MKRFFKNVSLVETNAGCAVALDGKQIKTPTGKLLTITSKPLAEAVADEWREQKNKVELKTMPLTTLSYAACDQVAENRALVEAEVAAYADTDLICYRADAPLELCEKEVAAWDPMVNWLKKNHGLNLVLINGISHVKQEDETLEFVSAYLASQCNFTLAALERITSLLGSIFLSIAINECELEANAAWEKSRVDENYQTEMWGEDAESMPEVEAKFAQFKAAAQFLTLVQD